MKKLFLYTVLLAAPFLCRAQFSTQGKISYERKTSLKLQMQTEDDNEWAKSMIDKIAQFTISDFVMTFNSEASEYEYVKEQDVKGMTFSWGGPGPGRDNKVYTSFKSGTVKAQKNAYENNYLVESARPQYQWKIESDMRMIAGYPCRKAVTKICDSVVVVAFYSDQLMVSGGPEGFGGLPGMILGLAIPRLYTTWFATNVELLPQEIKPFTAVKKSKKVSNEELMHDLQKSTKDWGGKYSSILTWWLAL